MDYRPINKGLSKIRKLHNFLFVRKGDVYQIENNSITFPYKLLTISTFITLITFGLLNAFISKHHDSYEKLIKYDMEIMDMKNKIIYYDEILTMSSLMAANEHQDFNLWRDRYINYENKLNDTIKRSIDFADDLGYNTTDVKKTDSANQELILMEMRAFEFDKNKKFIEARNILFSDDYKNYKQTYSSSIAKLNDDVEKSINSLLRKNEKYTTYIELATIAGILTLLAIWLYVLTHIKSWIKKTEESFGDLERFNFFIAHDLREPLRGIYSFSQLLEDKVSGHESKDYLQRIQNSCLYVRQLIDSLLSYGKLEKSRLKITQTNLNEMIDLICKESLSELVQETKALISFKDLPTISIDSIKIKQILINVISNGIVHNSSKVPKIDIEVKQGIGNWIISVRDNGLGIDKKYHEKIFTLFMRLGDKKSSHGLGIGLAICKKTIHQMGGNIWIKKSDKSGSIFNISVPKY